MKNNNIIIIREDDEVVACCVPLDGDFVKETAGIDLFLNRQEEMESVGELYTRLHDEFSNVADIQIVDPRNQIYLVPKMISEGLKNSIPIGKILKAAFLFRVPAVFVNGELLSSGKKNFTKEFIAQIREKIMQKGR